MTRLTSLVLGLAMLTACVPKGKYVALEEELASTRAQLEGEIATRDATIADQEATISRLQDQVRDLEGAIKKLTAELAGRERQIAALNDEGKTVSLVAVDGQIAGAIAMRDEPRPDAKSGLKLLTDAGIRTVMLTGDNRRTADAIGKQLGIEVEAELLPEDKQRMVGNFQKAGWSVAKIGDGINDAPALAAADVGIAMGGGTDVALETADAAVLHGRVADVAAMVDLSKRTMVNIRQNIFVALGLKAVFLITTVVGLTGLWPAILADTGATVLVTMNALRLLRLPATGSLEPKVARKL